MCRWSNNNNINHQCYMSVPNGFAEGGDAADVQHLLFGETEEQSALVNNRTACPFYESFCFKNLPGNFLQSCEYSIYQSKINQWSFDILGQFIVLAFLWSAFVSHFISRYLNLEEALTPLSIVHRSLTRTRQPHCLTPALQTCSTAPLAFAQL